MPRNAQESDRGYRPCGSLRAEATVDLPRWPRPLLALEGIKSVSRCRRAVIGLARSR
jgi:hypothetical protein